MDLDSASFQSLDRGLPAGGILNVLRSRGLSEPHSPEEVFNASLWTHFNVVF